MSNITITGLLSERPSPAAYVGGYFYATDLRKYYKSSGDTWVETTPDLSDISPTTVPVIAAGVADNGTIDPLGLDDNQSLKVHNTAIPGFNIPNFTKIELTYYPSTSNIHTITYKKQGNTVATLILSYDDSESASPLITSIELD